MTLYPGSLEPTCADNLSQAASIMSVGFIWHHFEDRISVTRIQANDRDTPLRQRVPEPDGKGTCLHSHPFDIRGALR
jgi:hypothetical protein